MPLPSLFLLAAFAVLAAVEAWALAFLSGHGDLMGGDVLQIGSREAALGLHGLTGAAAAGLGATAVPEDRPASRRTLFFFFGILVIFIPGVGLIMVGALALILATPSTGGLRPEERFVFGNPEAQAARRGSRGGQPLLVPLASALRRMEEAQLCQTLLGLQHLGPVQGILPFLLRFQQDPRTRVQFTAQALVSGAVERLEETLSSLRTRLGEFPDDPETRLAMADTLARLAEWSPKGDPGAILCRRDAVSLLDGLSDNPAVQSRSLPLLTRLHLAAADGPAAMASWLQWAEKVPTIDPALQQALQEALFYEARWDDLAGAARQSPPAPGASGQFWTSPPERPDHGSPS